MRREGERISWRCVCESGEEGEGRRKGEGGRASVSLQEVALLPPKTSGERKRGERELDHKFET